MPRNRITDVWLPLLKWKLLLGFWLWLAVHAQGATVVLHLRNGDRLTGDIVAENANQVTLRTVWQTEVVVPVPLIDRREKLPAEAAKSTPAAKEAVKALTPSPLPKGGALPKPKSHWAGQLNLGLDVVRSETDRELYQGSFNLTYGRDRFRNIFDYRAAYGETAGRLSANRMDGSAKTDFDLGARRRFFIYNLAGAGYDDVRKIDLQFEVGPGVGYHLVTRTNFVLNTELGGNFFEINFADGTTRDEMNLRIAEDFTWALTSKISFQEKLEFLPKPDDVSVYRLRFEGTLSYLLMKNLSLNLSLLDVYDARPARSVTPNDLQVRSSIGVKF